MLLLEAGGPDSVAELHIPAAFPAVFKSGLDWDLFGEEEPGLGGRRLYLPRGRVIGGSGSINAMIYLRGHRADFDEWAAAGCDGWSYDDVLPYFKRSEDNERGADEFHGVGGPLSVSDSRSMQPLIEVMLEAAVQAGYKHIPDLNVDRPEGVGRFQLTQRGGFRCSTADAYLNPALERENLEVVSGAFVQRIVFEGDRAVGVEVVRDGRVETVRAEREVILSAGAYQSPVLLMLSGIGPSEELAPLGIAVREELPVGRNMQDHFMAQLNYTTDEPTLFGTFTPENFALLNNEGRGPLTSNIPEAGGFFRTRDELEAPDVEFHFAPSMFFDQGLTAPSEGRVLLRPGRDQADEPRPRDAACAVARLEAARPVQLPHDRRGPAHARRRGAHRARDRGAACAEGGRTRAVQRSCVEPRTRTSSPGRRPPVSPCTTRPRPARWARSSTPSCASSGPPGCGSPTRPSCRRSRGRTRTRRRS